MESIAERQKKGVGRIRPFRAMPPCLCEERKRRSSLRDNPMLVGFCGQAAALRKRLLRRFPPLKDTISVNIYVTSISKKVSLIRFSRSRPCDRALNPD